MNEKIKNTLRALTREVHHLDDALLDRFSAIWKPFDAPRKTILTREGEDEKYLYIVMQGVQRVYAFDGAEKESTLVFTYPPSFGGVLDSLMMEKPSSYFYETLSPSSFYRASKEDLFHLMEEENGISVLVRKGITGALSGVMERLTELQTCSSEEKFRRLLKRSPHILQLIPHKYIANYLAIDATNFSKLINSVRI